MFCNSSRIILCLISILIFGITACSPRSEVSTHQQVSPKNTVLAIDFMRTLPGEQADYLKFVEQNWMAAREEAKKQGYVAGYEVIVRSPETEDWDVMLITEYVDAETHQRREAIFEAMFERPEFHTKPVSGKSSRDMAEFVGDEIVAQRY